MQLHRNMFVAWRTLVALAVATLSITSLSRPALADDDSFPQDWRADVNGWTFAPAIVDNGIVGFLGWATNASVVNDNIGIVWLQREGDGKWSSWAWKSNDFAKAVDAIRTSLGQQNLWAGSKDVVDKLNLLPPVVDPEAPTALLYGLFIDDPALSGVAASADPVQTVVALANVGWSAAPTISALVAQKDLANTGVPCDASSAATWNIDAIADTMTYEAETSIFASTSIDASQLCLAWPICFGCWSAVTAPSPWGGWTCTGSTTTSAGVLVCHYARTRTRTRSWTGATFWGCAACPSPVTETQTQTGDVRPLFGGCDCSGAAVPVITGTGSWQ